MTAIVNAISALNQSLEKLESVASDKEKVLKASQQDLFNNGSHANGVANGNSSSIAIDPAVLAKKLDVTIERVEQLLREA